MLQFYDHLRSELTKGVALVGATVIRRRGSAPRGAGARLTLNQEGELWGTVGGGQVEAEVLDLARAVFKSKQATLFHVDMMGPNFQASDMICGGMVDIYLEYFSPDDAELAAWLKTIEGLDRSAPKACLGTSLDRDRAWGRRAVIAADRVTLFPTGEQPDFGRIQETLARGRAIMTGLFGDWFIEPAAPRPMVYIFGGGHVSHQIAPLCSLVDFGVTVIDDRAEFTSKTNFPTADQILCQPFDDIVSRLPIDQFSYLVIVTRGHSFDGQVLAQALKTEAAYIGMIGSRSKRDAIYRHLLDSGFGPTDLDRVFSPIGLDIGGDTPEEIAVSIVAELIQVRAAKAKSLKKDWTG